MKTRGMTFLEKQGISFQAHPYEHREKGAEFAAAATGIALERMIKTLVVAEDGGKGVVFVLMPGDRELDLKLAARAAGWKKARMADVAEAEKLTGYQVGGISPFGARRTLPVLMEESLAGFDRVGINGGARGVIVELDPADIRSVLRPVIAPLARS